MATAQPRHATTYRPGRRHSFARRAAVLALCASAIAFATAAQAADETDTAAASSSVESEQSTRKARSLLGILLSRQTLSQDLARLQAELETTTARGREDSIHAEIQQISDKLADLDQSFSELSAELDPGDFSDEADTGPMDLSGEVRELLGPLVNELKRATSRPREIDRLRTEIGQTRDRLELLDSGLQNLAVLYRSVADPDLVAALDLERAEWLLLRQELATLYEIDRQKLDQMLDEQASLGEALESIFELFFKSRGRNLLLALAATVLFMVLLRRLQARALESAAMRARGDALLPRLLNLLFVMVMAIGGVLVFLLVLYFFGDWVLLILMLLIVFGALWASKQAIPRFWTQATLLLNLGPVREGERINVGGLPFVIEHLNFYTDLVNPNLIGGQVRVPISDLTDLRSRPFDEAEPWFPSEAGDFVVLSDDTFGRIKLQTPEQVVLRLMGGASKTLPTADYLALAPTNLSGGLMAKTVFSLDYAHLREITEEIPRMLREYVESKLRDTLLDGHVLDIGVFFSEAAASSIDVRVTVDLDGAAAEYYRIAPRILARLCVDACNEYDWSIPFPQLTVHAGTPVLRPVGDEEPEAGA